MNLEYVELPGTGTVFAAIVVREPLHDGAEEHVPYVAALIEADGAPGIRFVSNVVDCEVDEVTIGMPVRVEVEAGQWTPVHRGSVNRSFMG